MKKDSALSNLTNQIYTANAYTLSVSDYENSNKTKYISEGCLYKFALRL